MATALATQDRASPIVVLRQNLERMTPELKMALPAHVSVEKFQRVAMTAIQNQPDLLNCDRKSLFGAIVRLAQDGLLPDGREAALVKFGQQVQAMPMIAGVLKKIRQSGDVAKVSAQVVYEHDEFVWHLGFDEDVTHNPPPLDQPRGKAIGAYATAVLKDGSRLLEVMSLEEIEKVRAVSRAAKNGPWVAWWGEMARKTVMRRLSKRLPMSTDLEDQLERDETLPDHSALIEQTAEPVSRLDQLEQHIEANTGPDDEPDSQTNDARQPDVAATGGVDPSRATADRLIALARNGEAFAEADVAAFHNLPAELRSEVDAASETR
jgi:recombination protein RecT